MCNTVRLELDGEKAVAQITRGSVRPPCNDDFVQLASWPAYDEHTTTEDIVVLIDSTTATAHSKQRNATPSLKEFKTDEAPFAYGSTVNLTTHSAVVIVDQRDAR